MKSKYLALLLLCIPIAARAQCSPFQGLGATQFLDNSGVPLTNGVLYSFQAGTSTQQATFTDSTCTVQNVNPITFTTGARVNIWLTTGSFYKFQLCLQNDGSTCAPSDVLFSVDQVPGGASGGGGGGSGPPFVSGSPNPATTGILRCASGDQCIAFRNAANSANLSITKDTNDVLSWSGGSIKFPAVGTPSGLGSGFSWLWADSSASRWKVSNNGNAAVNLVVSGVDINTSDQVNQWHFGATATPLSGTAPTTGQVIEWNGTNIIGASPPESTFTWGFPFSQQLIGQVCTTSTSSPVCIVTTFAFAHTLTRFTYINDVTPAGCGTTAVIGVVDLTASTNLFTVTVPNGQSLGYKDSGAISASIPAAHVIGVGMITASAGCATPPNVGNVTMIYQ